MWSYAEFPNPRWRGVIRGVREYDRAAHRYYYLPNSAEVGVNVATGQGAYADGRKVYAAALKLWNQGVRGNVRVRVLGWFDGTYDRPLAPDSLKAFQEAEEKANGDAIWFGRKIPLVAVLRASQPFARDAQYDSQRAMQFAEEFGKRMDYQILDIKTVQIIAD